MVKALAGALSRSLAKTFAGLALVDLGSTAATDFLFEDSVVYEFEDSVQFEFEDA